MVFVSPDSALQFLKPNLELVGRELFDLACEHVSRGSVVWDVGANVGLFTFAAANTAGGDGEVLAIEADAFLASLLQRSAHYASNRDLSVNVLCAAASDRLGVARFLIAERGRSSNALEESGVRSQAGGTRCVQHVVTVTLDGLLETFRPPNLLKIDVEGAEELVLKGAHRLLSDCRFTIYIEVGHTQNDSVTSILKRNEYRLFDGGSRGGPELDHCTWNTLAIPREKGKAVVA
jgi:FkbM family methyltransferase